MQAVRLADGRTVILRRWTGGHHDIAPAERELLAANEATTLRALEGSDVPAPRLLAVDVTGADVGVPATLTTRLAGRVDLTPRDLGGWIDQLARALPPVHAAAVHPRPFEPWFDAAAPAMRGAVWDDAARLAAYVEGSDVFVHRDYQHFNVLWSRGRLCGIVDWTSSCAGHPDVDVGHCRLNLAVLFGPDAAERFRLAYEAEAGRTVDPRVDLAELLVYDERWRHMIAVQAHGVAVDTAGMTDRVRETVRAALTRAG